MENDLSISNKQTNDSPYIFISYSHEDQSTVFDDVAEYKKRNLNVWIDDKDIRHGNEWNVYVGNIINGENCHGAIIYLSSKYLVSEACMAELSIISNRRKEEAFSFKLVMLNGEGLMLNIADTFCWLSNSNRRMLETIYSYEKLKCVVDCLNTKILYFSHTDSNMVEKICDELAEELGHGIFLNDESRLGELYNRGKLNLTNGIYSLEFGEYPMSRSIQRSRPRDGMTVIGGKKSFGLAGIRYNIEKISWNVIKVDGNTLFLAASKALGFSEYSRLKEYLYKGFASIAFSTDIQELLLKEIDVPTQIMLEDLLKKGFVLSATEYAAATKNKYLPTVFYMRDASNRHILVNSKGIPVNTKVCEESFAFVIPVIILKINDYLNKE